MVSRINSASRINNILNKVISNASNLSALDVWSKAFDIIEDRASIKSHRVTTNLSFMFQEVALIRKYLVTTTFPPELYVNALANLEESFSGCLLLQPWANSTQYLNQITMTSLAYWVAILPDEESEISSAEFQELIELIDELEQLAETSTLPASLVEIIKHQIELMRTAINRYPISGVAGLKAAASSVYGELVLAKEELKAHPSEETSALAKVWGKFISVVDSADKVDKAIELSFKAADLFGKASNYLP